MPADARGSVFATRNGYGIRWPENGRRPQQTGFRTKTEARHWFAENVAWRTREWYDALDAAGIDRRGPYHLRHTFASEALAAGISILELSRLLGASVREIDRTYGHLVRDSEDAIRARLDARAGRSGVFMASEGGGGTDG